MASKNKVEKVEETDEERRNREAQEKAQKLLAEAETRYLNKVVVSGDSYLVQEVSAYIGVGEDMLPRYIQILGTTETKEITLIISGI